MNLRGGHRLNLKGRPNPHIETMAQPDHLVLSLRDGKTSFAEVQARSGQRLAAGDVIARTKTAESLPLRAPVSGTVHLDLQAGCAIMDDLRMDEPPMLSADSPMEMLLESSAWAYVVDASTGTIASPGTRPSAVIVSVVNLDNHVVRGDAILSAEQERFLKGIARIRSLFPDTPMHFAIPQPDSELSRRLIAELPSDGSVSLLRVPMRYGLDKPAILARMAGCKPSREPVWFIRAEGVVAIENALESRRPVTRRISAIGGPGANAPRHIDVLLGHPVDLLVKPSPDYRIIRGGVMQGEIITSGTGVAIGTQGLTVLPHLQERKLLGFARPGWRTRSCSRWFLSALRRWFPEDHTTGLRGERRACVACGLCRKVCPAGLWPQWIHKALFSGDVAEAQLLGLDLCVGCGLCTYACPAKLELSRDFRDGQDGAAKEASSTGAIS